MSDEAIIVVGRQAIADLMGLESVASLYLKRLRGPDGTRTCYMSELKRLGAVWQSRKLVDGKHSRCMYGYRHAIINYRMRVNQRRNLEKLARRG